MVPNVESRMTGLRLKNESYHHQNFTTRQSARRGVMRYIEVFHNSWQPLGNNAELRPATAMARFQTGSSRLPVAA